MGNGDRIGGYACAADSNLLEAGSDRFEHGFPGKKLEEGVLQRFIESDLENLEVMSTISWTVILSSMRTESQGSIVRMIDERS